MSTTSDIADHVANHINSLALGVKASRENTWIEYRESDSALHVIVVPVESSIDSETRGGFRREVRLIVVIQQKLAGMGSDKQRRDREDVLITLSERIEESLYGKQMGESSFWDLDAAGPRVLLDSANFAESGIFRTQIELVYVGDI